jgi:Uma2 family endonuclease
MTTQVQRLTYEEYLKLPEIKKRYDIIDGEMIMAPGSTTEHQFDSRRIFRLLDRFVVEHQLGEVLYAPLDILIQREPLRTRQPDILFVSNERRHILGPIIEGAPDLVVEILSPSNTRRGIEAKLADYAHLGVRECWLVSQEARTVEVLRLVDGAWQRAHLYGIGDRVRSDVLEGFESEVLQLFE